MAYTNGNTSKTSNTTNGNPATEPCDTCDTCEVCGQCISCDTDTCEVCGRHACDCTYYAIAHTHELRMYFEGEAIGSAVGTLDQIETTIKDILRNRHEHHDDSTAGLMEAVSNDPFNLGKGSKVATALLKELCEDLFSEDADMEDFLRVGCFVSQFTQAGYLPEDSFRLVDLATGNEEPLLLVVSEDK